MRNPVSFALLISILLLGACGESASTISASSQPESVQANQRAAPAAGFSVPLPHDAQQPWEESGRSPSVIDAGTAFSVGRDWFQGNGITENGEAGRIESQAAEFSYGIWRIPLGGLEPGTLSADVNLLEDGSGSASGYYVGVADYSTKHWSWQGPFFDSHVRLSLAGRLSAGSSYLSSAQNVFVSILAWDSARVDVVGLGLNPYNSADITSPPQPTGLTVLPVNGGLELRWNPVIAGDLAGYRVFHSGKSFTDAGSAGVRSLNMLEGSSHMVLPGLAGQTYVRIAALDHSGNSSALSDPVTATPLAGTPLSLLLETDSVGGGLGSQLQLSASGADTYDFDADGDGIFETGGNTTGQLTLDATATGIIRPRVRGVSGDAVALGSVSLLITGNSRPVAVAKADPATGTVPLEVSFSGTDSTDFDGTIVGGGWDFDGDGIYEIWNDADTAPVQAAVHNYAGAGMYNARLRVLDDAGAWDVDTLSIVAIPADSAVAADLQASTVSGPQPLVVNFDATASSGNAPLKYYWDFEGDGRIDLLDFSGLQSHTYTDDGSFTATVSVEDVDGDIGTATLEIGVQLNPNSPPTAALAADRTSGIAPFVINFDASGSNDPDGSIVKYEWDFDNNGSFDSYSAAPTEQHLYDLRGTYTCRLRVTDNDGDTDDATIDLQLPCDSSQFHMGPSMNRRSIYSGPPTNQGDWFYNIGSEAGYSTPAVGPDGTIYAGGGDGYLWAIKPDGSFKWNYDLVAATIWSSPAIGEDGTVYIGDPATGFHAVTSGGQQRWLFPTGGGVQGSPAIGADGTIYFGCNDDYIYAVHEDGTLKWKFLTGGDVFSSPAVASDGTVYCGSDDGSLYALDAAGNYLWDFPMGNIVRSSPALDDEGKIYIGSDAGVFYAINPDGTFVWPFVVGSPIRSTAAIAEDGSIYVGTDNGLLYALTPGGSVDWAWPTGNLVRSSPLIGADGVIYITGNAGTLYALNPNGSQKWAEGFISAVIYSSPVLGPDGSLYISDTTGKLLAYND